jgi:hypothetical protein
MDMEVEVGVQPNCSELVVVLPRPENLGEWKELLRTLENLTSWKAGIFDMIKIRDHHYSAAIPMSIDLLRMGKGTTVPYFTPRDIIRDKKWDKYLELAAQLKRGFGIYEIVDAIEHDPLYARDHGIIHLPPSLIPYRKAIVDRYLVDGIRIRETDGYCNDSPVLIASQHCYTPHFLPLAKIVRALDTEWHTEDGGDPESFYEWCINSGFCDVAKKGPL